MSVPGKTQLFFTSSDTASDNSYNALQDIAIDDNLTVGGAIDLLNYTDPSLNNQSFYINLDGAAVDPSTGKYFVSTFDDNTFATSILSGSLSSPNGTLTTLATDADASFLTGINSIAVDETTHTIYYSYFDQTETSPSQASTDTANGIYKISESGGAATQVAEIPAPFNATLGYNTTNPNAFALDLPNNLIFTVDSYNDSGSGLNFSQIWVSNTLSGHSTSLIAAPANADYLIKGVVYSAGTLYYSEVSVTNPADNKVLSATVNISGSGSGETATLSNTQVLYSGSSCPELLSLSIDPSTGLLYGSGSASNGSTASSVWVGSTHPTGGATMQLVTSNAGGAPAASLVLETAPTVAASGSAHFVAGGTAVTADSGVAVADADNFLIASATVSVTSGTFVGDGDTLSATVAGTGVTAAFSGETLTLSGAASAAVYEQVLDSVTFHRSAADPTDGGAFSTSTLTWTVSDGNVSSTSATSAVSLSLACYCRGAHILTERGEVVIEALRIGDRAVTASGGLRPIVWIGQRALDISRHPDPDAVRPVRVAVGAFGNGAPHRELWLSPGHNVACEGVLMPIASLINGVSIAQIDADQIEYWHVELDEHDVVLAEGLPAESYLDCGNRAAFANGGAFVEAHPDFRPKHEADTCLPLIKDGPQVAAAKARLLARLVEQGYVIDQEADAHVVVDGARVEPIRLSPSRLAFALPADGRKVTLRSNAFVPAHTVAESVDDRELGLCVGRLQIDGEDIVLDDDRHFRAGWHDLEPGQRWTRGVAPLPAGTRVVMIDLAGDGYYLRHPEATALARAG